MKPFTIILETEEYRDGGRFSVIRAKLQTPEDKEVDWAYLKAKDGVIVVALDRDGGVFIKKEWRLGRKDFVWELPSGWIEAHDPGTNEILEAGNRELQEEIGLKAGDVRLLGSFYVMNHSTSKFHIVLATDLESSALEKDEHEHLVAEKVPFADAYERLVNQQIPSAQVLIALNLAEKYLKNKEG